MECQGEGGSFRAQHCQPYRHLCQCLGTSLDGFPTATHQDRAFSPCTLRFLAVLLGEVKWGTRGKRKSWSSHWTLLRLEEKKVLCTQRRDLPVKGALCPPETLRAYLMAYCVQALVWALRIR